MLHIKTAPNGTVFIYGAGERIRTTDLLITNQLLYQLSYASTQAKEFNAFTHIRQSEKK